jgi:hypothetical protein
VWHYSRQKKEEERSLHYAGRLLRRSEEDEKASARFGWDGSFFAYAWLLRLFKQRSRE